MAVTEQDPHDITACARAWQTLHMAHDRVQQRLTATLAEQCGLAIHEFDVLLYLRLHQTDAMRMGAFLVAVPLSQPALSRLVAKLEVRRLVRRSETAADGRAIIVCLTPAGTTLIDQAIAIHARTVHETLTSKFSGEEQAMLLRTLSRIGQ